MLIKILSRWPGKVLFEKDCGRQRDGACRHEAAREGEIAAMNSTKEVNVHKFQARQGDVFIEAVDEIPAGAVEKKWHWHGVQVPAYVIDEPKRITVKAIDAEQNAEVRRVMIDRMGAAAYIKASGAKLIHQDECGKLWRKVVRDDEPIVMVEVINATPEPTGENRIYWLRVPPTTRTAHEGVAWTFGMKPGDYRPRIES